VITFVLAALTACCLSVTEKNCDIMCAIQLDIRHVRFEIKLDLLTFDICFLHSTHLFVCIWPVLVKSYPTSEVINGCMVVM